MTAQKKIVIWLFLFLQNFSGLLLADVSAGLFSVNVNRWENFTDLKNVVSISADRTANIAYCASGGGLFIVDLGNGTVLKKYTNLDGLININLTSVYVDSYNRAWIGASDGSICIMDYGAGIWKYIYDIKNSGENNKTINGFIQYGQYIFVATGYGIQKINVSNYNFVDAPYYQLGTINSKTMVNSLAILDDALYAATVSGIAYAGLINANLNNPAVWVNYLQSPMAANVKTVESFDGKIFFGSESGFVYYDKAGWVLYPNGNVAGTSIKSIKSAGTKIYFIASNKIYFAPKENLSEITQYYVDGSYNTITTDVNLNPIIGVTEKGILLNRGGTFISVFPNCPFRSVFDFLSIGSDGILWAAGGQNDAGFYRFDGNIWDTYTNATYPDIGGSNHFRKIYSIGGIVWALGYGGGPVRLQNGVIKNFNTTNSNLPGSVGYPTYCTPFGGAVDNNGIFWCSFFSSNNSSSLYAQTGDSLWTPFANPGIILNATLQQIAIDNYSTKWIASLQSPGGVYFFNENGTIGNPSDDVYGFYNTGEMTVDAVNFVIVDRNNEVWIATNNGIFIISNPLGAIQNPNNKPIPQKMGIISGNLKVPFTENCLTITVDILNQKWIGTENNGVFHLSEDGSTLIEQFNVSNSPILSNQINSIAVNGITGKAYFGTTTGLSAVQTDAVNPVEEFDKIICSPNPYLVPSSVNLKIDGLVEGSAIKIISLTGEIIAEFNSPGGRIATWNGQDRKGRQVSSGIYIIVAFNKDGSKVGKGKLAVIKK